MDKCEAAMDSVHEVFIQFPNSPTRELHPIVITSVHGEDLTVEKVRLSLLENHGIKNNRYQLAFRSEITKEIINVDQADKIINYLKYLTDPNYTIIFVLQ